MSTRGQGWLTKAKRKKGDVWLHHFYQTRESDGARVETCRTVGLVSKFPREADVWAEVERSQRISTIGKSGRATVSALAESYRTTELPLKSQSTRELHNHELNRYILPRWGKTYVDEVRVLEIKKWLIAIAEEQGFTTESIGKTKHVFSRLFSYGSENELIPVNLNPVEAKRTAVEALAVSTRTAGYDTIDDTISLPVNTRPV